MSKAKIWYQNNKYIILLAVILGMAWIFLHSVSIAARGSGQPWHVNEVLRLHIVAAADSHEQQELKIAIRDAIWPYVEATAGRAANMAEARDIIGEKLPQIEAAARQMAQSQGYSHDISATLVANRDFPAMSYAGIIFPQGRYEALQITIGAGAGSNWWCVMFPLLCLMEVTQAEVIELPDAPQQLVTRPRFALLEFWRGLFE